MANYNAGNLNVEFLGIDKSLSGTLQTIISRLERLEKVTNNLGRAGKNNKRNSDGFFSFPSIAKIGTFLTSMHRVARVGQQILQYGVDYTETLNLWQVAMGNNLSMAREFVTEMNKAYGISEKTLMNAQAIFKNMIGSLGQVSETTAYALSEAITQMAIDYASLYNVSIDSAITKFQAALAAQVRPIRSVSGYDITENTLYQLYQSIGGTKTMRQLSRTEKQLLSIYAVFQQMGASGALGDMKKTIDQVANQSRMMAENWETVATWAGISFQYILQETGAFKTINAILITMGEVLKSIAFSLGYETPDFANDWADNVQNTNEEIDKLQGKLLGFDKFRALGQADTNVLGIDQTLLEAISGYTSQIDVSINKARELADTWLKILGFTDENGDGIYEMTQEANIFLNVLKFIGIWIGVAFGKGAINSITKLITAFTGLNSAAALLKVTLVAGIIWAIMQMVKAFEEGEYWAGALYIAIAGASGLIFAFQLLKNITTITKLKMVDFLYGISGTLVAVTALVGGIIYFISSLEKLSDTAKILIPILSVLAGVIAAIAIAKAGFGFRAALTAGAIAAGIGMVTGTLLSVQKYADGGLPDKGTMFIAGEAGAEMVYNTPSGQSGVANISQIQQAMYGALVAYGRTQGGDNGQPIVVQIDGEKVFQATQKSAKKHGLAFSRV